MRSWIFIFLVVPYSYGTQLRETEYECGAHGRFEYCIDGVPGCVIGCHCHPGYYFDTDTKICEPNMRLTQNFRRNYDSIEPTRVVVPPTSPVIEEPATTATAKNAVDEKIDIITKDADDLGDWLYNQFFKTIENQVINETKDDTILTRRSDSAPPFVKKPSRRSHKYWRARRKRKKKKKGLKSKLLRITEDDSLFDSSSSSTSDESSDSSSSGTEESHEYPKERKVTSDHGHKKIVVFNKRPKPPLPSFIFLPNMETPFFPPIGLPAPPMPMYPMVPVPPMMGPFPFPAPSPACGTEAYKNNGNGDTQPTKADETSNNSTPPPENTPDNDNPPDDKPADDNSPDDKPADDNPLDDKPADDNSPDDKPADDNPQDDDPSGDNPIDNAPTETPPDDTPTDNQPTDAPASLRSRTKKQRGSRNKLMQKLREKLKRKNKLQNYFAKEYHGQPIIPRGFIANHLPNMHHKTLPETNMDQELATLQDVDFKYLSQLIHRADLNKTKHSPPTTPSAQMKKFLSLPLLSRRNNYDNYPDQIAEVLDSLANEPINRFPENKPLYESSNQHDSVLNQPIYNIPDHLMDKVPYQQTYNIPNQAPRNVPNQLTYNDPNNASHNVLNQALYTLPSQASYDEPNQTFHNIPNQSVYDELNQPSRNVPNQSFRNVPNQSAHNVLNQSPHYVPSQSPHNLPNQGFHNVPNQSHNIQNQSPYNFPNQSPYYVRNQTIYNVPHQPTYNAPNSPTYKVPNYPYNSSNQPNRNVPYSPNNNVPKQPSLNTNQPILNNQKFNLPNYNVVDQPNYAPLIQTSHRLPYRKKIEETNDGYYSNLGRQIASMIRNIDVDKEVDIEIKSNQQVPENPLTGRSGSQSYWERAVRSPYKEIMNSFKKEIDSLKSSNEDLFSLENKVNLATATEPTLSLHQLENIINQMEKAKSKLILTNGRSHKTTHQSKSSFNVNLLPGNDHKFHSNGQVSKRAHNNLSRQSKLNNKFNITSTRKHIHSKINPLPIGSLLFNDLFTLQASNKISNATTFTNNQTHANVSVIPTRKPNPVLTPHLMYKMPNEHFKSYTYNNFPVPPKPPLLRNLQLSYIQAPTNRTYYTHLSPIMLNHKAVHYFEGADINRNQYLYDKVVPVRPQSFSSNRVAPVTRYGSGVVPSVSYLNHGVHHFDYFDDIL